MEKQAYSNAYAVLIGIDDYRTFDGKKTDEKPGPNQLYGSLNDVRAWWNVCRAFGFDPARVRVLTSPMIDPSTLEGATSANIFPATAEQLKTSVSWLAARLVSEEEKGGVGLLVYSGHGYWKYGTGLLLCPSDICGPELDNAVLIDHLQQIVGQYPGAARNLTAVLDCCFSYEMSPRRGRRSLRVPGESGKPQGALTAPPVPPPPPLVAERLLLACRPHESAFEAEFAGRRHGAFSWALTSVLGQWKRVWENGVLRSDLSYRHARTRSRALLKALSYRQHPTLWGPDHAKVVARLPFLHPGDEVHEGETSRKPDGWREGIEVHPDWLFTLNFYYNETGRSTKVYVLGMSPGDGVLSDGSGNTYSAGTDGCEYWIYDKIGGSLSNDISQADRFWVDSCETNWVNIGSIVRGLTGVQFLKLKKKTQTDWSSTKSDVPFGNGVFVLQSDNVDMAVDLSGKAPVWYSSDCPQYTLSGLPSFQSRTTPDPEYSWYSLADEVAS